METKAKLLPRKQDRIILTEELECNTSSPEIKIAESSSPEQISPSEEPAVSTTLPQSLVDVQTASLTPHGPIDEHMSSLASQFSMLDSVMGADDVPDQMALEYTGSGIDDAIEIASRAAIVDAWQEAIDGDEDGFCMDDVGSFENCGS
jgi:hypothetical protein